MQLTELSIKVRIFCTRLYKWKKGDRASFFDYGYINESWSVRLDDLSSRTYAAMRWQAIYSTITANYNRQR